MEKFRYDRSSKWMIEHHGGVMLRLGGILDVERWWAIHAEVVQPRQLPDGLLEVQRTGRPQRDLFVIELMTYPDERAMDEAFDDMMLVYQNRRILPDVLIIVLHPKGNLRVEDRLELRSPNGFSGMIGNWRVVELWNVPATDLLATQDPGLMPWVPLTHFDGPPEPVFQRCRQVIEERARPEELRNLLAVSQVLAGLRYNEPHLLAFFGGREAMIESPVLQKLLAEWEAKGEAKADRKAVLTALHARFGNVPEEIATTLETIADMERLTDLIAFSAVCPDLEAFRARLSS